ncbi:MAG: hypothetical protein ACI4I9_01855 [Porcipelethomonas sp.]
MTSLIMLSANEEYEPVEKEIPVYTISENDAESKDSEKETCEASEETEAEQTEDEQEVFEECTEELIEDREECEECEEEYTETDESVSSAGLFGGIDTSFKAYMDYRCITDTSSVQYELQQQAYTDERGFRRIGDDYCAALGTGITDGCGERFLITLDSGSSFTVIVSDVKADCDTDSTCCYVPRYDGSGNVVEFIIDSDAADSDMLYSGNAGYYSDLSGNIESIVKL